MTVSRKAVNSNCCLPRESCMHFLIESSLPPPMPQRPLLAPLCRLRWEAQHNPAAPSSYSAPVDLPRCGRECAQWRRLTQHKNKGEIRQTGKLCRGMGENAFCYLDEQVTQEQMEIQSESPSSSLLHELQPTVLVHPRGKSPWLV